METEECPVCFEKVWVARTKCGHPICLKCILIMTENRCPCCRKKNVFNSLPNPIKNAMKLFKESSKKKETKPIVDINNHYDFPPLGS